MRAAPPARDGAAAQDGPAGAAAPQRIALGEGLRGPGVWQAYRATIATLFEVALPGGADPEAFTLGSDAWQAVHVSLRRSRGSAHILRRGPALIARGADQILVYAQIAGQVEHVCGGRAERIGPGDVTVYDYARPIESAAGAFENLGLLIDRDRAPAALLTAGAHGLRLAAGSGVADLLVAGLQALDARAGRLSMGEFEAAALGLAGLAAEAVRARSERNEAGGAPASAERLRVRALAYVDDHLGERALSPGHIAAHLGLSRSGLYRLFEAYGGVRLLILARRLDRAVQVLLDEPDSHRALGAVAKRHGFPGTAHFSRLFSERFGMPPSRYCALVREGDTGWLAAQHARARFADDLSAAWRDLGAHRPEPAAPGSEHGP